MRIFIPTLGRVNKQHTLNRMPAHIAEEATVVCPPEEVEAHENLNRNVLACPLKGIGPTRDFILAHARREYTKYIVMLDDDIVLQRRRRDFRITNTKDPNEYVSALQWLEDQLKYVVHCGWGTRFLAYASKANIFSPGRMMYCLAYDVEKVAESGATFTNGMLPDSTMEDFNMTLQLLRAGYPNRVSLEWRASPGASNAPGGCSTWRTTAIQTDSAMRLQEMFPEVVTTRLKKQWVGMQEGMYDVRIQWKKALSLYQR